MKVDPYTLLKNCKYCSALLQPIAMPRRFGYEGVEWYEITLDKYDGRKDVLWRQGVCNCDSAKRERESGYMSKEERERAGELLYLNSGLPKEFLDKKYDRALAAQNCPNALANLDTVQRYMQEVKSGGKTLLWLHGQGGMGKTHLSIITSNYIMRKYLLETRFVKWVEADKGFNDVRIDNRTLVSALKRVELL
jgi:DNA replication protein DnaC